MAKDNRITLYDLQLRTGATISPFVWATKYAIAHKGFEIDIVPGGFTGIVERTGGRSERLPAIVDDGKCVLDSWLIAEYLDETYPDRPTLIGDPGVKSLTEFVEGWLWRTAIGPWFQAFIVDYRDRSLPQDHQYVTESRERMLGGRKLEEVSVEGKAKLAQVPPTGESRAQALFDYAERHDLDLREAVAYADSTSDLPMLEVVGFPVAVNPEVRLAALARKRGWLIEHFDKAGGAPRRLVPIGPQRHRFGAGLANPMVGGRSA